MSAPVTLFEFTASAPEGAHVTLGRLGPPWLRVCFRVADREPIMAALGYS